MSRFVLNVALKNIVAMFSLLLFVMSINTSAKVSEDENSQDADSYSQCEEGATSKGELFLSEGAIIYNVEALSGAKITRIEKRVHEKNTVKKKFVKRVNRNKKKIKITETKNQIVFIKSERKQSSFFKISREEIVLLQESNHFLLKAKNVATKAIEKRLFNNAVDYVIYKNSVVKFIILFGKYFIRPPIFVGFLLA